MGFGQEFGAIGWLALIGAAAVLVVGVPGFCAGVAVLLWRVITTDWSLIATLVGGGIGALPALALGAALIWHWITGE